MSCHILLFKAPNPHVQPSQTLQAHIPGTSFFVRHQVLQSNQLPPAKLVGNRCCVMSEMAKAPTMRSWTNNPAYPERGSQLVPDMGRFPYYDHPIQMVLPRWMWQFDNLAGWKSHLCPIGNASTNGENSVPRQHKGNQSHLTTSPWWATEQRNQRRNGHCPYCYRVATY